MGIKEIANEYRSKNGDGNLTTKELLWFVIKKFDDVEATNTNTLQRVTKTETRQKMTMWFIVVAIPATGIIIGLIK